MFFFQAHSEINHTDLRTSEVKTIDTPTSRWIFDAKHEALARMFIADYEKVEKKLLPLLNEAPERTYFLIQDQTDDANGAATVVPFPMVTLYPVFPSTRSAIGEFLDSSYELVLHEYTHILNLYPRHGWITAFGFPLGNVSRPNMYLPRWMSEGLAVHTESQSGGRLQSQFFEGYARALTLENKWSDHPIDSINQAQPDWFGGARPYIWGGIWWQEFVSQFGNHKLNDINQSYSRRLPFLIQGPVEDHANGKNIYEIYDEALARVQQQTKKQMQIISQQVSILGKPINTNEIIPEVLSFSAQGNDLAIIGKDHHKKFIMLRSTTNEGGRKKFKTQTETVSFSQSEKIAWKKDGTGFYTDGIDTVLRFFKFSDIYFCKKEDLKCNKITKGLRAHNATLSGDEKTLYFIQNSPGSHLIGKTDTDGNNYSEVYNPPLHTRLVALENWNDKFLFFIEQKKGETNNLMAYDLTDKSLHFLKKDLGTANVLKLTNRGLLYSSAQSGVENIYLIELNQIEKWIADQNTVLESRAITNTMTRAVAADLEPSEGGLYYLNYTTQGPALFWISGPQWETLPDTPPAVPPIYDLPKNNLTTNSSPADTSKYLAEDYSVWNYMYPRYFIPMAYLIPQGTALNISTGAGDPVGHHSYNLSLGWDTLTQKASVSGSYTNQQLGFPLSLSAGLLNTYYYPLSLTQQQYFGSLQGSFFIPGLSNSWKAVTGWNLTHTEILQTSFDRQGPTVGIKYNNLTMKGKEISPEQGMDFGLFYSQYFKSLGNLGYGETSLHFEKYLSGGFLPDQHVVAFNTSATYAPENPFGFYLGASTLGVNFVNFRQNVHLLRGYLTGSHAGKNLASANLEYRMPMAYIFQGLGTLPVFLNRIHTRFFWDTATLDGFRYKPGSGYTPSSMGTFSNSVGMEIHTDLTLAYHLPFTSVIGLYYPIDADVSQGFTYFLGVQF